MIRPFRLEQQRYGEPSTMAESQFDHPFQWGSKRTGPDLAREGGKYPNLWHYRHLLDPRAVSPGSNMPPYALLADAHVDLARTTDKLHAMRSIGVPYTDADQEIALAARTPLAGGGDRAPTSQRPARRSLPTRSSSRSSRTCSASA